MALTMPSTRLTRVPEAINNELRPRFLRSVSSISASTAAILVIVISDEASSAEPGPGLMGWFGCERRGAEKKSPPEPIFDPAPVDAPAASAPEPIADNFPVESASPDRFSGPISPSCDPAGWGACLGARGLGTSSLGKLGRGTLRRASSPGSSGEPIAGNWLRSSAELRPRLGRSCEPSGAGARRGR